MKTFNCRHGDNREGNYMTDRRQELHDAIALSIDEMALRSIEGWEGLRALAERIEVDRIDLQTLSEADEKWSARGMVGLQLYNWDDEEFGEVRLHLSASGHGRGSGVSIDSLLISSAVH
jgi:hypothetical protein